MSQIHNVVKTDSRSMFHVPVATSLKPTGNASANSTNQFGVSLQTLLERDCGELPLVIRKCTEYLEQEGLEVVGIFRRAPNNVKVRAIKKQLDQGRCGCGQRRWVWVRSEKMGVGAVRGDGCGCGQRR